MEVARAAARMFGGQLERDEAMGQALLGVAEHLAQWRGQGDARGHAFLCAKGRVLQARRKELRRRELILPLETESGDDYASLRETVVLLQASAPRPAQAVALRANGETYQQIGEALRVSRQRAQALVERAQQTCREAA